MLSGTIKQLNFKPSVLGEQVSTILTKAILDDTLKGGQQLVEAELQKQFGISRSPLREAFRDLEKKGLVVIIPRRGTFVKKVISQDIQEIFPVRAVLEGLAAKEAYNKMSDKELKRMGETLQKMQKAVKRNDTKTYWENHLIFHDIFIGASGNVTLIDLLEILRMNSHRYRFSHQFYLEDFENSMADHKKIYDFFASSDSDPDEIAKFVQDHIESALAPFLQYLEKNEQE